VLSERLRTIYGPALILPAVWEEKKVSDEPLRIRIWLELPQGTAVVDLSKAAVRLGGRTLYPAAGRLGTGEKLEGPIQLAGQSTAHMFELMYEVRTTELEPFTLHIPDVQVNGRLVALDPIAFRRGKRELPR
jgi:hypothetical protein